MSKFRWALLIILLVVPLNLGNAQFVSPEVDLASELLDSMTSSERVGQLFIVTLNGSAVTPSDQIIDLIVNYHVSGVLLKRGNDNFADQPETLNALQTLIGTLQESRYEAALAGDADELFISGSTSVYVPLFIVSEEPGSANGIPEILEGKTKIPSQMSIGATWNPALAQEAGEILGRELEALGFNMIIGPSLDVLEQPQITGGNIGVESFGGDPFWVGLMGKEFINGLHIGSQDGLAVIAKHFPGLGSIDRPIDEEVATVRKTIDQLTQTDLAPFLDVTSTQPGGNPTTADGLLVGHIRYQGFHGNIRATTRPISLDPQALTALMELAPLKDWREGGGVTVSDSLGSNAIRRFKDPSEQVFQAHLVARDAFLAGNDLLLLSDFRDNSDPDEYTTIVNTLEFFANKYDEDELFAQQVDDAVLRILRLKTRIYGGSFFYPDVANHVNIFDETNQDMSLANAVAQSAATLLSPALDEIEDRVEGAPKIGERIVFFSDVRQVTQCSTCNEIDVIPLTALEDAVIRLFGPAAAGQVGSWNLRSYSMADLSNYLGETPTEVPVVPLISTDEIDEAVRLSDWLIFSVLDSGSTEYGANALKLLLDLRPDLASSKKLIVFGHDTPNILDATDVSKIDVYHALFDGTSPFIDVAAKLLFQEVSAPGASPVSVASIGYDLIEVTSPNPDQIIQLVIGGGSEEGTDEPPTGYSVGDVLKIETAVIVDNNGNPVPDNTPVDFIITQQSEGVSAATINAFTVAGIARTDVALERTGLLSITAQSGKAQVSEILQFNVDVDVPAQATLISPTLSPTLTVEPSPETNDPTPTSGPQTGGDSGEIPGENQLGFVGLVFGALGLAVVGGAGYATVIRQNIPEAIRIRCILLPIVGGLLGYNYLALDLPGASSLLSATGPFSGFIVAIITGASAFVFTQIWCQKHFTEKK
ncbi:MAG: glycoside hydrolase family 3 N-terminal domain-containing protein [Anaerolineales bacterium]